MGTPPLVVCIRQHIFHGTCFTVFHQLFTISTPRHLLLPETVLKRLRVHCPANKPEHQIWDGLVGIRQSIFHENFWRTKNADGVPEIEELQKWSFDPEISCQVGIAGQRCNDGQTRTRQKNKTLQLERRKGHSGIMEAQSRTRIALCLM